MSGDRFRAVPVCGVPARAPCGVFVQGRGFCPSCGPSMKLWATPSVAEGWWAPHDRTRGAFGRLRLSGRPRAAVPERLCRYALRPAVGQERLHVSPEGQVVLDLRRRWADGTTQLVFDPAEFLERLAALAFDGAQATLSLCRRVVPRPRINLVLYDGVLAPRAAWRDAVVAGTGAPEERRVCGHGGRVGRRPNRAWAELMERSFPPSPRLWRASLSTSRESGWV